jgi:hypothetical protein
MVTGPDPVLGSAGKPSAITAAMAQVTADNTYGEGPHQAVRKPAAGRHTIRPINVHARADPSAPW